MLLLFMKQNIIESEVHPNINAEQPRLTIVPYFVPEEEYDTYFNPSGYTLRIKAWKIILPIVIIIGLFFIFRK